MNTPLDPCMNTPLDPWVVRPSTSIARFGFMNYLMSCVPETQKNIPIVPPPLGFTIPMGQFDSEPCLSPYQTMRPSASWNLCIYRVCWREDCYHITTLSWAGPQSMLIVDNNTSIHKNRRSPSVGHSRWGVPMVCYSSSSDCNLDKLMQMHKQPCTKVVIRKRGLEGILCSNNVLVHIMPSKT